MKTHLAVAYTAYGEQRTRSLCGRSSAFVRNTATIESGQNVTDDQAKVSCKFCQRMLAAQRRAAMGLRG